MGTFHISVLVTSPALLPTVWNDPSGTIWREKRGMSVLAYSFSKGPFSGGHPSAFAREHDQAAEWVSQAGLRMTALQDMTRYGKDLSADITRTVEIARQRTIYSQRKIRMS
jgi:hypothetical protein